MESKLLGLPMNENPVSPQVFLNEVELLLSLLAKNAQVSDLTKYYTVESNLNLANLSNKVTMSAVFARMVSSQQNRSMMPNVIKYWDYQNTLFDKVLKHHNPREVLETYSEAEDLYQTIRNEWPKDAKPLDYEMKGLWAQWCKAVLSAARFLVQFNDVGELHDAFASLYNNPWARPALPAMLAMEIQGMQFALACDFLKECGYDYPKPDTHLVDVFELFCGSRDTYVIYRKIIEVAQALNITAYKLDKMIWLVCSGNFYLDNIKCHPRKEELIVKLQQYI